MAEGRILTVFNPIRGGPEKPQAKHLDKQAIADLKSGGEETGTLERAADNAELE